MFENASIRRHRGTKKWFITTVELLGLDRVIFLRSKPIWQRKKSLPGAQALAAVDDAGIDWGKADDSVKDGD